ncbi:MAG: hypothetical protein KC476_05720 [Cyanobacteria bacterium HKST-UBA06]|nr:hypothetical protein [Cyanobacteria bacterium HKST-UBA06]
MSQTRGLNSLKQRFNWVLHFVLLMAIISVTLWLLTTDTRLNQLAAQRPHSATIATVTTVAHAPAGGSAPIRNPLYRLVHEFVHGGGVGG